MGVFDTGIRLDHPHVKNIKCVQTSQLGFGLYLIQNKLYALQEIMASRRACAF